MYRSRGGCLFIYLFNFHFFYVKLNCFLTCHYNKIFAHLHTYLLKSGAPQHQKMSSEGVMSARTCFVSKSYITFFLYTIYIIVSICFMPSISCDFNVNDKL